MGHGARPASRLRLFPAHVSLEAERDAAKFVGKDEDLSGIYLPNGLCTLRLHDEIREGGYELSAVPIISVSDIYGNLNVYSALEDLPDPQAGASTALFDINVPAGGLDLTDWVPPDPDRSMIYSFRKVSNSSGTIRWTCHLGINYTFCATQGEIITLYYDAILHQLFIM